MEGLLKEFSTRLLIKRIGLPHEVRAFPLLKEIYVGTEQMSFNTLQLHR